MLSAIISRYDVVVIINVIFIAFFDCDYELWKLKISRKLISSIFHNVETSLFEKEK